MLCKIVDQVLKTLRRLLNQYFRVVYHQEELAALGAEDTPARSFCLNVLLTLDVVLDLVK